VDWAVRFALGNGGVAAPIRLYRRAIIYDGNCLALQLHLKCVSTACSVMQDELHIISNPPRDCRSHARHSVSLQPSVIAHCQTAYDVTLHRDRDADCVAYAQARFERAAL